MKLMRDPNHSIKVYTSFVGYVLSFCVNLFFVIVLYQSSEHRKKARRCHFPDFYNTMTSLLFIDMSYACLRSILFMVAPDDPSLLDTATPLCAKLMLPILNGLLFCRYWVLCALSLERFQYFYKNGQESVSIWEHIPWSLILGCTSAMIDVFLMPDLSLRTNVTVKYDWTLVVSNTIYFINIFAPTLLTIVFLVHSYCIFSKTVSPNGNQLNYKRFLNGRLLKVVVALGFLSGMQTGTYGLMTICFKWQVVLQAFGKQHVTDEFLFVFFVSTTISNFYLLPWMKQSMASCLRKGCCRKRSSCSNKDKKASDPESTVPASYSLSDETFAYGTAKREADYMDTSDYQQVRDRTTSFTVGFTSTPFRSSPTGAAPSTAHYARFSSFDSNHMPARARHRFSSGDIYQSRNSLITASRRASLTLHRHERERDSSNRIFAVRAPHTDSELLAATSGYPASSHVVRFAPVIHPRNEPSFENENK